MTHRIDSETLKTEIARLRGLGLPELRTVWEQCYRTTAPRTLRRDLLVRSVAWHIQAAAAGGLKPSTRTYLRQLAQGARSGTVMRAFSAGRIKPGTKLIRVWQDKTHTVMALAEGFEWQGSRYRSLSKIARTITGSRWNGLVFFGVKARPMTPKAAIGPTAADPETVHA